MHSYLPSVALARRLAKQRGLDGTIVIGFAKGEYSLASYGGTLRQCHELGKLVDFIVQSIEEERVKLPAFDPAAGAAQTSDASS